MKKLLTMIGSLFSGSSSSAMSGKHEASMNFDLESVGPFLIELNTKFDFGFRSEIDKMVEFSESIPVNEEESIFIEISTNGEKSTMEFHVFMDDIDAPDLYFFFEQAKLAEEVGDFMMGWAEARGM